ncbi:MAG: hypothetical protein HIU93_08155 [Acidobacteria bacterium]|uniref:Uncharacterized protein n=1 Tax=Acidipila rosea TaxID=768535 RepID=A0A4R1LB41_9BACT|nr:hypothetical protein [Acidobacteriota bacterium]TCK75565.1 hypothetical protein C7378_0550 [Acidipila rosea]
MEVSRIIAELDNEITRLQQARTLLAGENAPKKRGRKKSVAASTAKVLAAAPARRGSRKLSAEGRRKIAEAMKKRWAERKGQGSTKSSK